MLSSRRRIDQARSTLIESNAQIERANPTRESNAPLRIWLEFSQFDQVRLRERGLLARNLISDLGVYCNGGGKNSAETRKHFR